VPDQTISLPLKEALPSLRSPDGIHRLAMSFLPDLAGASRAARAERPIPGVLIYDFVTADLAARTISLNQ